MKNHFSPKHPRFKRFFIVKIVEKQRKENLETLGIKVKQIELMDKVLLKSTNQTIDVPRAVSYVKSSEIVKTIIKTKKFVSSENLFHLTKRQLLLLKQRRNSNSCDADDKLILKKFDDFDEFTNTQNFRNFGLDEEIKIHKLNLDLTLDALKTYRESERKASHHTQLSIKNSNIIVVCMFHEGKESRIVSSQFDSIYGNF